MIQPSIRPSFLMVTSLPQKPQASSSRKLLAHCRLLAQPTLMTQFHQALVRSQTLPHLLQRQLPFLHHSQLHQQLSLSQQ